MLVKLEFKDLLMSDGFRERKSKLVDEKSRLHQIVTELRTEIRNLWPKCLTYPDRQVHVEWSKKNMSEEDMKQKARSLQGKFVDLSDDQLWGWLGNAFVLFLNRDRKLHCTVLCFKTSQTPESDALQKCVPKVVRKNMLSR